MQPIVRFLLCFSNFQAFFPSRKSQTWATTRVNASETFVACPEISAETVDVCRKRGSMLATTTPGGGTSYRTWSVREGKLRQLNTVIFSSLERLTLNPKQTAKSDGCRFGCQSTRMAANEVFNSRTGRVSSVGLRESCTQAWCHMNM